MKNIIKSITNRNSDECTFFAKTIFYIVLAFFIYIILS